MGRRAKPWYYRPWGQWVTEMGDARTRLGEPGPKAATKGGAEAHFRRIMAEGKAARRAGVTVAGLADIFMSYVEREHAPATIAAYEWRLSGFITHVGPDAPVADIRPRHITEWMAAQPTWGPTTRWGAIGAVKRLFKWGKEQGYIEVDSLAGMKRGRAGRREEILSAPQVAALLAAIPDPQFRDFVTALRETGARPGEVWNLTADRVDLDGGTWRVRNKTRTTTGEEFRTVYLAPAMIEMSRRLVAEHPTGRIFLNTKGRPWCRSAVGKRFRELRKASKLNLGPGAVAYSLRHLYITDALERGIPPATVAELVGHRDLSMIMRCYNKIRLRTDHLREAARAIRPPGPDPAAP